MNERKLLIERIFHVFDCLLNELKKTKKNLNPQIFSIYDYFFFHIFFCFKMTQMVVIVIVLTSGRVIHVMSLEVTLISFIFDI